MGAFTTLFMQCVITEIGTVILLQLQYFDWVSVFINDLAKKTWQHCFCSYTLPLSQLTVSFHKQVRYFGAGMRSLLLNGGFIEKKRDPIAEVPLHEVAKMHAWGASGAGMRSWLLNGGFVEKKRAPNCGSTIA